MSPRAASQRHSASVPAAAAASEPVSWPQGVSHEPEMKIGELVERLRPAFPALSISKVRYLETEGLISPHRLGNGYRRYSQADVERLRFTLTAQRDEYLPLSVIRQRLDELDAAGSAAARAPRVVTADGELVDGEGMDAEELAARVGLTRAELDEYVGAGVLRPGAEGTFPAGSVRLVRLAMRAHALGIPVRNLRVVRTAALREADAIAQAVAPRRARSAADGEQAGAELAQVVAQLHEALLHRALDAQS